jgi:DNA gyrase/topoisomerase IV subunit B
MYILIRFLGLLMLNQDADVDKCHLKSLVLFFFFEIV